MAIDVPCLRLSLASGAPLSPPPSFIFKATIGSLEQICKVFLKCRQLKYKCSSYALLIILQLSPSTLCMYSSLNGDCKNVKRIFFLSFSVPASHFPIPLVLIPSLSKYFKKANIFQEGKIAQRNTLFFCFVFFLELRLKTVYTQVTLVKLP